MTAVQRGALRFCRQIALSTKPEASFERDTPTFFEQSALQAAASLEVWSINRRSSWASSMIASFVEACCHFTTLREIDNPCLLCASKTHAYSFHVALFLPLKSCRLTCCEEVALIPSIQAGYPALVILINLMKLNSVVSPDL
jgi:hypothetical protein